MIKYSKWVLQKQNPFLFLPSKTIGQHV